MTRYVENTISALCYEIAARHVGPERSSSAGYNDVIGFVREQLVRMPSFLSLPIKMATAFFGMSRLPLEGSLFHRRDSSRRTLQVEIWKRSRLGACRDLMKFYTSLVVLALYSRPEADRSREASS